MGKTLAQLLAALPEDTILRVTGEDNAVITSPVVEADSDILPGGVFVARKGLSVDGHDFIGRALERGAVAVVGERNLSDLIVPYVQVNDSQAVVGLLAAVYHDFPSRKLIVIGVTGTDGKTTTSHLIHGILQAATQNRSGLISTIEADLGASTETTGLHVTTPGAPQVQEYLAQMVENGLTHCVLEMTSHGLAQGRLNGVDIDIAVLTNVTHEHLDYHGSWEEYRAAKAIMFEMLVTAYRKPDQPKIAVINHDDPSADFFAAIPADKVIRYGLSEAADCQATTIEYGPGRTQFRLTYDGVERPQIFDTRFFGEFNVLNCLAALGVGFAFATAPEHMVEGLRRVEAISGRMERIDEGQDFTAIVDFAHTPNALRRALEAGRQILAPGKRLIAVFGSAGLRDVEKRRMMAEVSAQLADVTVLTAEDPRTESLDDILQMMAEGCIRQGGVEGKTFIRVPDRGQALYRACQMAEPGDIVMACGKGHEQSMCFGIIEYDWDDREALRAALRGTPLRTLPTAPEAES